MLLKAAQLRNFLILSAFFPNLVKLEVCSLPQLQAQKFCHYQAPIWLATAATNAAGSTGLDKCNWKPALNNC